MNSRIVRRVTARLRARGTITGDVTIEEITEFEEFETVDGSRHAVERQKEYRIDAGDPVNRRDAAFTLVRTGERLVLL